MSTPEERNPELIKQEIIQKIILELERLLKVPRSPYKEKILHSTDQIEDKRRKAWFTAVMMYLNQAVRINALNKTDKEELKQLMWTVSEEFFVDDAMIDKTEKLIDNFIKTNKNP